MLQSVRGRGVGHVLGHGVGSWRRAPSSVWRALSARVSVVFIASSLVETRWMQAFAGTSRPSRRRQAFDPVVVLLREDCSDEANQGETVEKIPATSARRRVSRFEHS